MKCPKCGKDSGYGCNEICEEPFELHDRTGFVQYWSGECLACNETMVIREVFIFDESRNKAMTEEEFLAELEKIKDGTWDGE